MLLLVAAAFLPRVVTNLTGELAQPYLTDKDLLFSFSLQFQFFFWNITWLMTKLSHEV